MRVFVTGGSGWIGSALVPELITAGHQVLGLARSDESAAVLEAAGVEVLRGSLTELDSLEEGAAKSDGVIHLAFIHDFSQYEASQLVDLHAIEKLGAALEGTDKPLVLASGVGTHRSGDSATEDDLPHPDFPRAASATLTLDLAERGVRSSIVRLPPTVHGLGDNGFVAMLVNIALQKGTSGYVGEGANRWPAVHRMDAARVFRLALESAPARAILHAVADEGVAARRIAEVIGRHLDLPLASIPSEEAVDHFGWLGLIFAADLPTSSQLTQARFNWAPRHPGLIEDLDQGHYFEHPERRGLPL